MSASLVGSEMCIRDRPCLLLLRGKGVQQTALLGDHQRLVARVGVSRLSPVSYTHLTLPTICSV
eukprot:3629951-Alexandrium_andersonii.AAC.1